MTMPGKPRESLSVKKFLSYGAVISGSVVTFLGAAFAVMYVLEAVVYRLGEADQSLLFWYLPILFVGMIGISVGFSLVVWGRNRLKAIWRQAADGDGRQGAVRR